MLAIVRDLVLSVQVECITMLCDTKRQAFVLERSRGFVHLGEGCCDGLGRFVPLWPVFVVQARVCS